MMDKLILAENNYLRGGFKKNMNCLILGVPGSGKTRGHVLPNLCELSEASAVLLDPKGELYSLTADMMKKRGFIVKLVDFDNPLNSKSEKYNPLLYCKTSDDIITVSRLLLQNQFKNSVDPFWPQAAQILGNALIGYLVEETEAEDRTFRSLMKLINCLDFRYDADYQSTLDIMFSDLKEINPKSWALEQYSLFKKASFSEKTSSSIVISLIAAFAGYMTEPVKKLTDSDTLNISSIGHQKTVLYVKSSDSDRSKDAMVSILFQQIFNVLFHEADKTPNHALPVHTHIFLDDIGTNLTISDLDCIVAACRSREISCSIILQSVGQLVKQYGEAYTAILGSCASLVFLGSNDIETCREMSYRINKPLTDVLYKDSKDIYVFTQGERQVKTKVFDVTKHSNYPMVKDFCSSTEKSYIVK